MNITLGFSPCPNDTYIFAALVNGWIDTHGLEFTVIMEDVEKLNEWASSSRLDITKMSFHRALTLDQKYKLLRSGSALGNGCGPLLISKKSRTTDEIIRGPVVLPGQWTTAHFLFNLFYPGCHEKRFVIFNEIESILEKDEAVGGVIIHENRFTYESKGLVKIMDLGEAWEMKTGLPIPLGGIFASYRIPDELKLTIENLISESILFADLHPETVMPYVRKYSQEMDDEVMMSHIKLYVNEFSRDLGDLGNKSIEEFKKMVM